MDLAKDQHANISALVEHLRSKTTEGTINAYNSAVQTQLDPAVQSMDSVLARLALVNVPGFLISTDAKVANLGDFISADDIRLLKANIAIYKENCSKAHRLLKTKLDELSLLHLANSAQFTRLSKTYDSLIVAIELLLRSAATSKNPPRDLSNLVKTILRENASLEQELVSLLQMLTNHYDQCLLALSLTEKGGPVSDVNFDVLHQDTMELQVVLKEFGAIHDIVMNNEARAAKFVADRLPTVEEFMLQTDQLIESYRTFKTHNITTFVLLLLRCEHIFRLCSVPDPLDRSVLPIDTYTAVVSQLYHHYTQFEAIFKSQYLRELHYEKYEYPRKFLEALHDFLNGPLLQLEDEERARRRAWLAQYGNFIPRELQLPGEENQPRLLQVISEGLDQLHASNAEEDENAILLLLNQ